MTHAQPLQRTPLYSRQQSLGARFVPFSGWEMPVQYQGVKAEHQAVRTQVGIFDVSHMGKFTLRGANMGQQLGRMVPTDLTTLSPGQGQYTVLLNSEGKILDDIILYAEGPDPETPEWECWTTIVNAATLVEDREWIRQHLTAGELTDLSSSHLLLAIQGPQAEDKLQPLIAESLGDLNRFQHQRVTIKGPDLQSSFIARTGYTGEDGFEIMPPVEIGLWLWDQLINADVQPCGLGCRDTLRLEAAMHLYGQDMDETTTPLEASLKWLVNSSADYIGRDPLEHQQQQGISRKLVGLQMQGREIARHGYPIFHADQLVGQITSGTKSPTLNQAIALGYLPPQLAKVGTEVEVEIRGKRCLAEVVKRPFYRSPNPAPRE